MRVPMSIILMPFALLTTAATDPTKTLRAGLWNERFAVEVVPDGGAGSGGASPGQASPGQASPGRASDETSCYDARVIGSPDNVLATEDEGSCGYFDLQLDSGSITVTLTCHDKPPMNFSGPATGTYSPDAYSLAGTFRTVVDGHRVTVRVSTSAHRTGPCPAD